MSGVDDEPGMKLPIVYPAELKGSFMLFRQWTAQNNVIPAELSGVNTEALSTFEEGVN